MRFKSTQVKGKGRGKLLGFPTINLQIPKKFDLEDGIYAVKVFIGGQAPLIKGQEFIGALHFGPVPTFKEHEKTLEVFLINTEDEDIPKSDNFEIEIIKYLRPILSFYSQEELANQIGKDVEETKRILKV